MRRDRRGLGVGKLLLLAVAGVLAYGGCTLLAERREWRDSGRTMGDIRRISTALETYFIAHGDYPTLRHANVPQLQRFLDPRDARELSELDPWGNSYLIEAGRNRYVITSWGGDGRAGCPVPPQANGETDHPGADFVFDTGSWVTWRYWPCKL